MEEEALRTATVVPPDELGSHSAPRSSSATPPHPVQGGGAIRARQLGFRKGYGTVLLLGILLPVFTLFIELYSHMCAEALFDPLSTWLHVFLVGLVPASNIAILTFADGNPKYRRWMAYANAAAIGVASLYSIAFAPMMPMAAFGMIFGIGFLPLTPFLSLLATIKARRYLRVG